MLSRLTLGTQNQKITECIAGEAPTLSAAKRAFPSHYPLMGRMKNTPGTFVWHEKKLLLKTKTQIYHVDEYHILYRLEQLGLKRNTGPQSVTLDAVWLVNKIDGLRLIYLETAKLK